ncbi:lysophospholipase L1-like esterase [Streptomyces sp. B3I7]|uniref:SGNH/GDSL hydrolase family protein n=1 Tax=Streptomyces sp. B3I7 TaxID=3042269 RepID=UPI0027861E53|nr:SGNH/GDSL hydrolase family protein [Streptomyces sp. B3I7]MDQ0815265.1 lysophospholipase L1-like esterase [Streptomyces sp. B3I7]
MRIRTNNIRRDEADARRTEANARLATVPSRPSRARRRRSTLSAAALLAAVGTLGALAGCCDDEATGTKTTGAGAASSSSAPAGESGSGTDTKVLWVGDSIAGVEAPPLGAALKASGASFKNDSSDGGGTVVEGDRMSTALARSTWKQLRKDLASFRPDVLAYQITTYDWGTPAQQRASYEKLARAAGDAGADLVLVSAPPYKIDDFYAGHTDAIKSAPEAAEAVAKAHARKVHFLDASKLWGTDGTAARAQRSSDGIHSCQQGSAGFAKWFTERLGALYDFTPAAPERWAEDGWAGDRRYAELGCG